MPPGMYSCIFTRSPLPSAQGVKPPSSRGQVIDCQVTPGVPVATVGINAGKNAGLLALQILATSDKSLEEKLKTYKQKMSDENETKGEKLSEIGYKKYLER